VSIEQLLAFRHEQLLAMPPDLLDFISAMMNVSTCPGNWSDCYRTNTTELPSPQPHHPGVSDMPLNGDNEPTTDEPDEPEVITRDPGSTPAATEKPTIVVMITDGDVIVVTVRDEQNATDSNSANDLQQTRPPSNNDDSYRDVPFIDPFENPSLIDDLVDSIPDRITSQNVEQFAAFLSFLPAAQIASRLVPEAVS